MERFAPDVVAGWSGAVRYRLQARVCMWDAWRRGPMAHGVVTYQCAARVPDYHITVSSCGYAIS